jgi:hypothetical protein
MFGVAMSLPLEGLCVPRPSLETSFWKIDGKSLKSKKLSRKNAGPLKVNNAQLPVCRLLYQTHKQGEKRYAFDQRGRNYHRGLDVSGYFRLSGHAFHRARTDSADAVSRAEDYQARAERGALQNGKTGGRRRSGRPLGRTDRRGHGQQGRQT